MCVCVCMCARTCVCFWTLSECRYFSYASCALLWNVRKSCWVSRLMLCWDVHMLPSLYVVLPILNSAGLLFKGIIGGMCKLLKRGAP